MPDSVNHVTTGIRSILSLPWVYSLYQKMVFPREVLVRDYLTPYPGQRVLDIGCGTGHIIEHLPPVEYIGMDVSLNYIQKARKRYGDRATFHHVAIDEITVPKVQYFDLALAIGVLHHISDLEALRLLTLAKSALAPAGRFIAVEPCYGEDQSFLARWIISKDRGQNVKDKPGYHQLVSTVFNRFTIHIRHDLLRIPYTLAIIECFA